MNAILEEHKIAIAELCRQLGVSKLDVFGSATRPDFDPARSDFDFILAFDHHGPDSARRFIAFTEALESLLGRPVDLVFDRAMKPRFRDFVAGSREVVFESTDCSIAA
jgi:predicted nucleotidyltransferase